ncbi:DUF475 domain-containing protein, partial [Frankia sp. AvcI1]
IGALAIILAISIETEVPEIVTGLVGVAFIGLALVSSIRHRRRHADDDADSTGSAGGEGGQGQPREAVGAPL